MRNPVDKRANPLGILLGNKYADFGGDIRYVFRGNLEVARSHIGAGASFVKMAFNAMNYAKIQNISLRRVMFDDTEIFVEIVQNQADVTIFSPVFGGKKAPYNLLKLGPEWIKVRDIWCTGGDRGYLFGGGDFGNGIYEIALVMPKWKEGFTDLILNTTSLAAAGDYPAGTKSLTTCQLSSPRGDLQQLVPTPGYAENLYIACFPELGAGFPASVSFYNSAMTFAAMPSRMTAGILLRQQINRKNPAPNDDEFHISPGKDNVFGFGLSFIADFYEWASAFSGQVLAYKGSNEPNLIPLNDIHAIQQDVVAYCFGGDAQFPAEDDSDIIKGAWQMTWAEPKIQAVRIGYDFSSNDLVSFCVDSSNTGLFYSNFNGFDWEIGFHDILSISKRLYAVVVGYVSKSALDHTDGGVDYYKSTAEFKVRVAQIEDDGTMNTIPLQFVPAQLFGPSDNTYCYAAPSGETEFTYLPCSYDVVCAPKNTVLICKNRHSSVLTTVGAIGASAMDCVAILTRLETGSSWSLTQPSNIKANVAVWAKDGSAFISRRWVSQKFAPADILEGEWTFRLEQKEGSVDSEAYSYDLYLFNGTTFVNALTIRPTTYPPQSWSNLGHYCFYHSDNLETIVIVGSSNANGIYTKNPDGTLTTLYSGQDGFEPIFISPDGRCVATNTMIFLDGEQVAAPARCAGVFFDYGAYMDYDVGTELEPGPGLCIKDMSANVAASVITDPPYVFENQPDCPVITTLGTQYNFWELAPDSSVAVCSRFYRDAETENVDPVMMMIVDFANGPYKFETTDQVIAHHFPNDGSIIDSGTDFYYFQDIYGKSDEDGIPYGCRYWGISAVNDIVDYFLVYTIPEWGFNGYWFYEYDQWQSNQTYRAQDSVATSDTNNAWYLGSSEYHHRAMVDWPTGQNTGPAICHTYSDAYDRRKNDSNYLDKRIYSHLFYHKVGVMERVWQGLGEVPEEARLIMKIERETEEV